MAANRSNALYLRSMAFEIGAEKAAAKAEIDRITAVNVGVLKLALQPQLDKIAELQEQERVLFPKRAAALAAAADTGPVVEVESSCVKIRQRNAVLHLVRHVGTQTMEQDEADVDMEHDED